jgi:hypothetical protein
MTETLFDMENLNCLNCGRPLDAGVCGWCDVRPLHRKNDPVTSMKGARDVAPRAGSQKALLLEQYRLAYPGGLTDEEAAAAAGLHTGAWKRCSDLRNADLIEPTGETRKSSAGSEAMVCRWKDVHARSSNPVPVPADAPAHTHDWGFDIPGYYGHAVCRECGTRR